VFFLMIKRPEREAGPTDGFLIREPLPRVRGDLLLRVKLKLVLEFPLNGASLEEGTQS
jgi:hypothetical protein